MPASSLLADASLSSALTSFGVIALAELGDKSQLVCMTLAARHPARPVALGAIAAFFVLNALAVLFGATVAAWLPESVVSAAVALLFAIFGIAALRQSDEEADDEIREAPRYGVAATTFALIFLAEFGDKTQLAVAALSSTNDAAAVWIGATLALSLTSLLGVYAGQRLMRRLPLHWLHRASGVFFLILAGLALSQLLSP